MWRASRPRPSNASGRSTTSERGTSRCGPMPKALARTSAAPSSDENVLPPLRCGAAMKGFTRFLYGWAARLRVVYWFVFRPNTQGVKCLIEHDGRWLMIRNSYGKGHWTFPGGAIGRHETP